MPSTTSKQARFMAAAAHDPGFARRNGISQKVAKDFNQADKGSGMIHPKVDHNGHRVTTKRNRVSRDS